VEPVTERLKEETMGKRIFLSAVLLALIIAGAAVASNAFAFDGFDVYTDKWSPSNHYIPSGWMGDYNDMKFNDTCADLPHSGKQCMKISYGVKAEQGAGWVGIFWQNPANNWGARDGGFDLTGAKALTFWARGENGGEVVTEFKMGGITGEYADSDSVGIGPIVLTKEWKQYSIDLTGADLSYISGGFCFSAGKMDNPNGLTFYLDDIRYE